MVILKDEAMPECDMQQRYRFWLSHSLQVVENSIFDTQPMAIKTMKHVNGPCLLDMACKIMPYDVLD